MSKSSESATKADLKALQNSIDARFNDADKRMKKFVFDAADYIIEALYKNMKEMEARTNGKIENVQKDLDD